MDRFIPIDRSTWERDSLFRLYTEIFTTTHFSSSVRIDVTETVKMAKERGEKFVPAVLYCFSRELSRETAFCVAERQGVLGRWEVMHPVYPVLNPSGHFTFHTIRYCEDYSKFYADYIAEQERSRDAREAYAEPAPENSYIISVMPFLKFESFAFSFKNAKGYYTPTISVGKYAEENGRLMMPIAATVNHATTDGYHVSLLYDGIERLMLDPGEWMK